MTAWAVLASIALGPVEVPVDTVGVMLTGQVRMEAYRSGPGLPGAVIEIRQGDQLRSSVSDARGHYRVAGLSPGRAELQVRHMAAEPHTMTLTLPARGVVVVDVELDRRMISLPGVGVHMRALHALTPRPAVAFSVAEPRHPIFRMRVLESSSGLVESGLAHRSLISPPGEEDRPPEQVLFMRGSTVDSRMVLLDGAPILTPFHLAGLVPSFDPRSLGEARVYLGGAPSRFEGGLSYVLDVESRPALAEEPTVEVALDGLAARGALNLRLGEQAGVFASARTFHGTHGSLGATGGLPYSFEDLLVRGDADLGRAGELRVTHFRNREGVVLDFGGPLQTLGGERTEWGNRAVSARWRVDAGESQLELLAATARYEAALPVVWDDPLLARTVADRDRFTVQLLRPWSGLGIGSSTPGVLRIGGSFERQDLGYRLDLAGDAEEDLLKRSRLATGTQEVRGDRLGLFGEVEAPLGANVTFQGGGRIDRFNREGGVRFSPRAALSVDLTDEARLTLSGGRFHQYVPEPGLEEEMREDAPSTLDWNAGLGVGSATHLVIELDQSLSPEFSLGVSGFVKRFEESGSLGGRRVDASGTDLRVNRVGDRFEGWVGYSLSWFWEAGVGGSSAADFAGRHLLTTGTRIRSRAGFEFGASIEYGAGLPLTGVPFSTADGPERAGDGSTPTLSGGSSVTPFAGSTIDNPLDLALEDEFLRLDLEVSWVTRPRIRGWDTELRPYVRVLNALDRRDSLFYYFEPWRGSEIRPLAEQPILPLIGLEWRF